MNSSIWNRLAAAVCLVAATAMPLAAQNRETKAAIAQGEMNLLTQAQQALAAADAAGAQSYAKSLYEDAQWRLRTAQENWNAAKQSARDEARLRADEGLWAARAALAKANWAGTNAAIRGLQSDITRFGGRSELTLSEEPANLAFMRGQTSKERIAFAQRAVDAAKAIGAEQIADNNIRSAEQNLETARKIASNNATSENADHLAYDAEMMARRAYYLTRQTEAARLVPNLQIERTRLAQVASEQAAAAERAQREQAERQAAELQRQLAAEQANRQAQAAEVERLRAQIDESRRAAQARLESDRQARVSAEQQLDDLRRRYETAIATGSTADIETLRRQVEDQQLAVRAAQQREQLDQQALEAEVTALRSDLDAAQRAGTMSAAVLSERQADLIRRQADLDALRAARQADIDARADLDRRANEAIVAAQQRRQAADAEAQRLQQQALEAQQQAQQAMQQADQARLAAQQAQQQVAETQAAAQQQAQAAQQQTQAAQQQAQSAQQQAQAAQQQAQAAQQQADATRAELERTRQELAARDAEARTLRIQQALSRVATTRNDPRGIIVTLTGSLLFDTGKTALKPGAKTTLGRVADQLKNESGVKILVEGHTDNVGTTAKNQELSEKRANAVREYLVSRGINADRITAQGRGEEAPVATNKTAAGRQQNRRVELVITQ